jgi:hypothetical protein
VGHRAHATPFRRGAGPIATREDMIFS